MVKHYSSCMTLAGYQMSKKSAEAVYAEAGISASDVDVCELHDCFSANELMTYEALQFCPEGGAGKFIDEGSNTYPVLFGDFNRGYMVVDRVQLAVLRDPFTQATSGNVRYVARRRVGGQVIQAEAIRKLKCST